MGGGDFTGHNHGAVVLGLLDGVVAAPASVVGPGLQHGELEVEVGVQGEQDGQRGEDDVRDEGGDYGGEGVGEAGLFISLYVCVYGQLASWGGGL